MDLTHIFLVSKIRFYNSIFPTLQFYYRLILPQLYVMMFMILGEQHKQTVYIEKALRFFK